jgi:hypothetical protein
MLIKPKKPIILFILLITLLGAFVVYRLDLFSKKHEPKKLDTNKEDIYFSAVIKEIKKIGLSIAVPEVTKNKQDVLVAAEVSCELKKSGLEDYQIKEIISSDPRAKADTEEKKLVLDIIISKALEVYCND